MRLLALPLLPGYLGENGRQGSAAAGVLAGMLLRIAQRPRGLTFRFGEIPLAQIALRHDKGPVDRHEQVAVSNADAGYPLLHLQRLLRPGVRKMAVAEDVAHQAINPDIAAGHLAQQRFDNSDTAGNIVGKGFADRANDPQLHPRAVGQRPTMRRRLRLNGVEQLASVAKPEAVG